jgi:hypothetical protein
MAEYRFVDLEKREEQEFAARILGPGITSPGVQYWFASVEEAQSFVENLNLSYWDGKQLSAIRKRRLSGGGALKESAHLTRTASCGKR